MWIECPVDFPRRFAGAGPDCLPLIGTLQYLLNVVTEDCLCLGKRQWAKVSGWCAACQAQRRAKTDAAEEIWRGELIVTMTGYVCLPFVVFWRFSCM